MNKPNTEIKRWGIIVVQSLTPNDVKTGEILYHDVLQYKEYHKRESFSSCNYSAPLTRKCQKSALIISKLVLGLFPNSC